MSINPSSAIAKALSRSAGEAYVAYMLARHGWLAVNANGGSNMPNVDIVALKGNKRITLQVKAAKADKSIPLAGTFKPDGKYFNTKDGPKADFVVAVMLPRDVKIAPACYIFPAKSANRIANKIGRSIAGKPKRDGSKKSLTFPIWLKGKDRDYAEKFTVAWDKLGRSVN